MKLFVHKRASSSPSHQGKKSPFPLTLELEGTKDTLTVDHVQKELHRQLPKYYPERQRLTKDTTVLKPGHLLNEFDVNDGDTITFKDLGPQVSWTTVFVVEYIGPLLIHPLFYSASKLIYGRAFEHSDIQRFSLATMPVRNIFKNSIHYHLFAGLLIAYPLYGPNYGVDGASIAGRNPAVTYACAGIWAFAQISNFITHVTLRNLRPPGTKARAIPYGYGFDLVTSPNYLFEIVAWLAYSVLVNHWSAYLFTVLGAVQMFQWAVKKHSNYKKEFKDYPKHRKVIIPFIL